MCIVFFATPPKCSKYSFILSANRDEFFHRPSQHASKLKAPYDDIIGGCDITTGREGGMWLGVNWRKGRIGILTNYRQAFDEVDANKRGRGEIVRQILSEDTVNAYMKQLFEYRHDYNGFNSIAIDGLDSYNSNNSQLKMSYLTNMEQRDYLDKILSRSSSCETCSVDKDAVGPKCTSIDVHGLTNKTLDDPWPKIVDGRERFEKIVREHSCSKREDSEDVLINNLLDLMACDKKYAEHLLPNTGVPIEWESHLSSICVHFPEKQYGTQVTTIVLWSNEYVRFIEKSHHGEKLYVDIKQPLHEVEI